MIPSYLIDAETSFENSYHAFILAAESAEAHLALAHINDYGYVSSVFFFAKEVRKSFVEMISILKNPNEGKSRHRNYVDIFLYTDHQTLTVEVDGLTDFIKDEKIISRLNDAFTELTYEVSALLLDYHAAFNGLKASQ